MRNRSSSVSQNPAATLGLLLANLPKSEVVAAHESLRDEAKVAVEKYATLLKEPLTVGAYNSLTLLQSDIETLAKASTSIRTAVQLLNTKVHQLEQDLQAIGPAKVKEATLANEKAVKAGRIVDQQYAHTIATVNSVGKLRELELNTRPLVASVEYKKEYCQTLLAAVVSRNGVSVTDSEVIVTQRITNPTAETSQVRDLLIALSYSSVKALLTQQEAVLATAAFHELAGLKPDQFKIRSETPAEVSHVIELCTVAMESLHEATQAEVIASQCLKQVKETKDLLRKENDPLTKIEINTLLTSQVETLGKAVAQSDSAKKQATVSEAYFRSAVKSVSRSEKEPSTQRYHLAKTACNSIHDTIKHLPSKFIDTQSVDVRIKELEEAVRVRENNVKIQGAKLLKNEDFTQDLKAAIDLRDVDKITELKEKFPNQASALNDYIYENKALLNDATELEAYKGVAKKLEPLAITSDTPRPCGVFIPDNSGKYGTLEESQTIDRLHTAAFQYEDTKSDVQVLGIKLDAYLDLNSEDQKNVREKNSHKMVDHNAPIIASILSSRKKEFDIYKESAAKGEVSDALSAPLYTKWKVNIVQMGEVVLQAFNNLNESVADNPDTALINLAEAEYSHRMLPHSDEEVLEKREAFVREGLRQCKIEKAAIRQKNPTGDPIMSSEDEQKKRGELMKEFDDKRPMPLSEFSDLLKAAVQDKSLQDRLQRLVARVQKKEDINPEDINFLLDKMSSAFMGQATAKLSEVEMRSLIETKMKENSGRYEREFAMMTITESLSSQNEEGIKKSDNKTDAPRLGSIVSQAVMGKAIETSHLIEEKFPRAADNTASADLSQSHSPVTPTGGLPKWCRKSEEPKAQAAPAGVNEDKAAVTGTEKTQESGESRGQTFGSH